MEEKKEIEIKIEYLFWYFIIFSIIGLIIEIIFCYVTTGNIESRKGLVYGPFCPVYGVGATAIICVLHRYKDEPLKLFLYGILLGTVSEYILSYVLELIYNIRFWDYSYMKYNLNGRICLKFNFYWGFLSLLLVKVIKKYIDKIIKRIPKRKLITEIFFVFIVLDAFLTVIAISSYKNRAINNETTKDKYIEKVFSDEFMLKTFPNLRIKDENGKELFIKDIINNN